MYNQYTQVEQVAQNKVFARNTTESERQAFFNSVGTSVSLDMSVQEIIDKADLNYEVFVEDYPLDDTWREGSAVRVVGRVSNIDGKKIQFGQTSRFWKPFSNQDVIGNFYKFCVDHDLKLERVGQFNHGKVIFAVADLGRQIVIAGEDEIEAKLVLSNSHVPGEAHRNSIMCVRKVCLNGMMSPVSVRTASIRHNSIFTQDSAHRVMRSVMQGLIQYEEQSTLLAKTPLTQEQAHSIVVKVMGNPDKSLEDQPKCVQQILELYNGRGMGSEMMTAYNTAWGLQQATTEWTQYYSQQRGGVNSHVQSWIMGSKANKNQQMYRQLVSVAGM